MVLLHAEEALYSEARARMQSSVAEFHSTFAIPWITIVSFRRHRGLKIMAKATAKKPAKKKVAAKKPAKKK
jgi:hypothetical protein